MTGYFYMEPKDVFFLESIVIYCDRILSAIKKFNITEEKFYSDEHLQDMLAFSVIQIGENAVELSEKFTNSHKEIEWRKIIGFRNNIVHDYGDFIPAILWEAIQSKIPELRDYCAKIINK